jgi:hypothetical protein
MTNKPVELHHDDFDDDDRELVWMTTSPIFEQVRDLLHHHSDGEAWAPWPEDDTAEVARQAHEVIDRMDQAVRQARRHLVQAERPARLRALRRVRAAGRQEQERDR